MTESLWNPGLISVIRSELSFESTQQPQAPKGCRLELRSLVTKNRADRPVVHLGIREVVAVMINRRHITAVRPRSLLLQTDFPFPA